MNFNTDKLNQVVSEAKAKAAGNQRWINAIDKAVAGLTGGWVVTELMAGLLITTENGTYLANGRCSCKAYQLNQPCKHRAAARLVESYNEAGNGMNSPISSRATLIADIQTVWQAKFPTESLADALMSRFRTNSLNSLNVDFLHRIYSAIA